MKTFEKLENLVWNWAIERGLDDPEQAQMQLLKTAEELGELIGAHLKGDEEGIKDGIGDVIVTLIIYYRKVGQKFEPDDFKFRQASISFLFGYLMFSVSDEILNGNDDINLENIEFLICDICRAFNLTHEECLEHAYNEIKDRTGKKVDGVFVKDE